MPAERSMLVKGSYLQYRRRVASSTAGLIRLSTEAVMPGDRCIGRMTRRHMRRLIALARLLSKPRAVFIAGGLPTSAPPRGAARCGGARAWPGPHDSRRRRPLPAVSHCPTRCPTPGAQPTPAQSICKGLYSGCALLKQHADHIPFAHHLLQHLPECLRCPACKPAARQGTHHTRRRSPSASPQLFAFLSLDAILAAATTSCRAHATKKQACA